MRVLKSLIVERPHIPSLGERCRGQRGLIQIRKTTKSNIPENNITHCEAVGYVLVPGRGLEPRRELPR